MEDLRLEGWPRPALSDMHSWRFKSQRERAAQRAIAPPLRVSTARHIGHRQRLGDLDAPPDLPTSNHTTASVRRLSCRTPVATRLAPRPRLLPLTTTQRFDSYPDPDSHHTSDHHHHRECSSLIVSDTGGDSTHIPDSHHTSNHHHHRECSLLVVLDSVLVARRVEQRQLDSDDDPDSDPNATLTTTTASARRSLCRTAATRLRHRPRLASRPDSNHHHRECSSLIVSDSGDSTHTPTPTRTTASARRSSCRAFVRMRLYTQADVDHALNTPPSPSDRPGKVYGLRVKHPDSSVVLKKDDIVLLWEVPTNHASKLESLCHRLFKANDAWMTPEGCESCSVFHREKFLADELGGSDEARKLVEQMAEKMRDRGE
ncbi:hypothetical protein K438DRAFT_1989894 [Mycena galopus ATCC 62051]|nr:hypothetical protein K438DRAFT_1989894 [Mycena galopus ATCC 62051]